MSTNNKQEQSLQTGHVGLNVSDLERSKRFYQEVFGFQLLGHSQTEGRRFVFLGDGQKLVLTLWEQSEGLFEKHRPGLHHLSFQVETIEKLREFENKLRALDVHFIYDGIVPHAEGTDSGGIFFEDPDGIRLEIYTPSGAGIYEAPQQGAPSCGFF